MNVFKTWLLVFTFWGASLHATAGAGSADEDTQPPPPPSSPDQRKASAAVTDVVNLFCRVLVDEKGKGRSIKVLRTEPRIALSPRELQKWADAALSWTFKPVLKDGKPVEAYIELPMHVDLAEPVPIAKNGRK